MTMKWNMEYFSSDVCLQLPEPNFCPRNISFKLLLWLLVLLLVFDFYSTCRSSAPGYTAFAITVTVHRLCMLEWLWLYSLFSENWSAKEHAAPWGQEWRTARTPKIGYALKVLVKPYPQPCSWDIPAQLNPDWLRSCLYVTVCQWQLWL